MAIRRLFVQDKQVGAGAVNIAYREVKNLIRTNIRASKSPTCVVAELVKTSTAKHLVKTRTGIDDVLAITTVDEVVSVKTFNYVAGVSPK